MAGQPSAGYSFNSMQEIKSHSSILYNERMAILFYMLDMRSMSLNSTKSVGMINPVLATLKQIYKNVRTLIRNNPTMRHWLNLNVDDKPGVYITDIMFLKVESMIIHCENDVWTMNRIRVIINEMNNMEMILKDCLQYYNYFIRPDFKQKPDVEVATEMYKGMADDNSIEDLKKVVGPNHLIDFESLKSGVNMVAPSKKLEAVMDDIIDDDDDEDDE